MYCANTLTRKHLILLITLKHKKDACCLQQFANARTKRCVALNTKNIAKVNLFMLVVQ